MTQADNKFDFKYTVPMEKSLRGDRWIIRGVAAGTKVDKQNDLITPAGIRMLADQINDGEIPFRNQHQGESITEDIGEVVKAYVTPDFDLEVEVELDKDNPDAVYLWKKLEVGKKFGMSIKGQTLRPTPTVDKESGKMVREHGFVMISEVSATTRPVYSHSLGTVIQKAIDLADANGATGENTIMETPTTGEAQNVSESSAPEKDSTNQSISPSQELVKSLMADDGFKTFIAETVKAAANTDSVEDSTEKVEKSETEDDKSSPDFEVLVKSIVTELNASTDAKLEAVLAKLADRGPAVLVKSETETADEMIAEITSEPRKALRLGLAAMHGELDQI